MNKQIIYRKQSELRGLSISPEKYEDETELQKIIAINPQLVIRNPKSEIIFSKREVKIENAGFADLILLDSEGFPIIVEVKLANNAQIRREIIGQIFDYVSSIRDFSYPQLNEATKGELEREIKKFAKKNKSSDMFDNIKTQCADNLKDEQIKMVIAVDSAKPELIRIVDFVNDHSNIDLCLVAINKYSIDNDTIFVPSFIVDGGFNFNDGTKQFSMKLQHREIILEVKKVFTRKYNEWLNELKNNLNEGAKEKEGDDEGWYYKFKIYQRRGGLHSELYVRMLNNDNKMIHLAFGFSQDFVNGLNKYFVGCSGLKNIKTQSLDRITNEIEDAFLKNNYKIKDEQKGWFEKIDDKVEEIGFESFKNFAKKEMEIIKPIIEKIVIKP